MDKRAILVVGVILLCAVPTSNGAAPVPATTQAARADSLLKPIREKHKLPGIVAAIVEGDDVIAIGASGVRRIDKPQRITVDDNLHLGSCTKAMTATMLARLVERKQLAWNSTVPQVFPDLAPRLDAGYATATLERMLAHRAGLIDNVPWMLLGSDKSTTEQRVNLIRLAMSEKPQSEPGTTFFYSNVGYCVAAAMGEKVTGRSWERLMQEELFDPLGMTSAGFGPTGTIDNVDQPYGHLPLGKLAMPSQADNPASIGPSGRVHCSMRDWAKFISVHLRGARGEATALLSAESMARLHRPVGGDDYALGWGVTTRPWAGGTVLTHSGSNTMWYCVVWIAPKKNFAVLAATNIGGDDAAQGCDDAAAAMIGYYYRTHPLLKLPATRKAG